MTLGKTTNPSLNERIKEFRRDPEKMDVTTKFVNELLENAKTEATRRMKEREKVQAINFDSGSPRKRRRWQSRARGFFTRIFSSVCFCNTETKV